MHACLDRELEWLEFNRRVLTQAEDDRVRLRERLKLVAIVAGNLDQFFMKRTGGLERFDECGGLVRELDRRLRPALGRVLAGLEEHGISVRTCDRLARADREHLRTYYLDNVFPLVTPQATDPAHPLPFISNLSLNLLVALRHECDEGSLARVKVPVGAGIPRFLELPYRSVFVPLESVMAHNLDLLFPGMEIESCALFRVTRNANVDLHDGIAHDLLSPIESELRERKFAPIVRLQVDAGMEERQRALLVAAFGLDRKTDVHDADGMQGMRSLWELVTLPHPALRADPRPGPGASRDNGHGARSAAPRRGSLPLHSGGGTPWRTLTCPARSRRSTSDRTASTCWWRVWSAANR